MHNCLVSRAWQRRLSAGPGCLSPFPPGSFGDVTVNVSTQPPSQSRFSSGAASEITPVSFDAVSRTTASVDHYRAPLDPFTSVRPSQVHSPRSALAEKIAVEERDVWHQVLALVASGDEIR